MYQKVLAPLDGSKESEGVLSRFKQELAPDGEVILLMVIPPRKTQALGGGHVILGSQREEAERAYALNYLRHAARQEGEAPGQWRCEVIIAGSVGAGIVDFATWEGADLIAMYTHDRKGLARLFKGSIASDVQRTATTEVRLFTPSDSVVHIPTQAPTAVEVDTEAKTSPIAKTLKVADVFKGLSDEQIGAVVPMVQRVHVPAGQSLGHADELGDHIFVIADGEAELTAHTGVGDIAARVAGPGESFPLAVLVGSGSLITSAEALTDMELLQLGRSQLVTLCSLNPELGLLVYRNVAEVLVGRYSDTLRHLARSVERELSESSSSRSE